MDVQEVTVMVNFNFLRKLQEILINMVAWNGILTTKYAYSQLLHSQFKSENYWLSVNYPLLQ
jgi:hypothetical protein